MWGGVAFRGSGGASIVGVNSFVRYFSRKRTWPSRFGGGGGGDSGSNSSLIQGRINSTERNPTWPSRFGGGSGSNSSLAQGRINSPTWPSRFGGGNGSNSSLIQGRINSTERNPTWPSRFGGGGGGGDMIMTVNLLGIEGSRSGNLHQQHQQQQQQKLDLEAMTQQRLPIISSFQHQLSHGFDQSISHGLDQSGMENNIWDV